MGLFDTHKEARDQSIRVHTRASAWDLHNIEEIHRKRKQQGEIFVILVAFILIGAVLVYYKMSVLWGSIFIVIGLFLFLYLLKGFGNKRDHRTRRTNYKRYKSRRNRRR